MNVLFIGDSITQGRLGESFVALIRAAKPSYRIQNLGRDGETLNLIRSNLSGALKRTTDLIS